MANQEDYANLALALALLGQSAVAAYPESGAFMMATQAQDVARAKLAEEARKRAEKKAKKKQTMGSIGGMIGAAAGSPFGTGGAAIGSSLGSALAGGGASSINPAAFGGKNALTFTKPNWVRNPFKPVTPYDTYSESM
jgi:hypothetical protein